MAQLIPLTFGWVNLFPGGSSGDVRVVGYSCSEEDEEESEEGDSDGEEDVGLSEVLEEDLEKY